VVSVGCHRIHLLSCLFLCRCDVQLSDLLNPGSATGELNGLRCLEASGFVFPFSFVYLDFFYFYLRFIVLCSLMSCLSYSFCLLCTSSFIMKLLFFFVNFLFSPPRAPFLVFHLSRFISVIFFHPFSYPVYLFLSLVTIFIPVYIFLRFWKICPVDIGGSFTGGNAAEAWSWPLTSI
jgi:hypothetical protein